MNQPHQEYSWIVSIHINYTLFYFLYIAWIIISEKVMFVYWHKNNAISNLFIDPYCLFLSQMFQISYIVFKKYYNILYFFLDLSQFFHFLFAGKVMLQKKVYVFLHIVSASFTFIFFNYF